MPRPATGTTDWRYNPLTKRYQWMVRLTLDDGPTATSPRSLGIAIRLTDEDVRRTYLPW